MADTASRSSSKKRPTAKRSGARAATGRPASSSRSARSSTGGSQKDAIALLKADHREVEGWFAQFEKATADSRKNDLAGRICRALRVHASIEEEIFYPQFLAATGDKDLHHEAEIEHEGARRLIADIEGSDASDEHFDARVKVLSEMIKHHVKEEEQPGGMFAEARKSEMDLRDIGAKLQARKKSMQDGGEPALRRNRGKLTALMSLGG